MEKPTDQTARFANDVYKGLQKPDKSLPSKYFYDETGDSIFREIMEMPEYYLTNAELEILTHQKEAICDVIEVKRSPFNLLEFGAGDGLKTRVMLKYLSKQNTDLTYYPIDISRNILQLLKDSLKQEIPGLQVSPLNMEYFNALSYMHRLNDLRTITLFLGSNIGNFRMEKAGEFLANLSGNSQPGDMLLLGVDLKKDPKTILLAYDDPAGVTARFNLNLLNRINRELGGTFRVGNFRHVVEYDEKSGEVNSYLASVTDQRVFIKFLDWEVHFRKGERIHTEISRKYSLEELEKLAGENGFSLVHHFVDNREYFTDTLLKVS